MTRFNILSTKKLKPSLVQQLEQSNIALTTHEFISAKPILDEELHQKIINLASGGIQTIAFTSKNAVEVMNMYMHKGDSYFSVPWQICCLSGATKQAVADALLLENNVIVLADDAAVLAEAIIHKGIKEIIFFCGNKRREDLPTILKNAGVIVHEVILYETVETPKIIAGELDAVLFFSPSAVQSFFAANQLSANTICFAIGKTTAETIALYTNNKIITSESPSQEMLLSSVQFYFKNINCYE
jgi:uroporphyrinogen-III synthase